MDDRIMYVEDKSASLNGPARIARVEFSRTGRTCTIGEQTFHRIKGGGYKANWYDVATGDEYWISGCRRDGRDRLYASAIPVTIDAEVREAYWRDVRDAPDRTGEASYICPSGRS